MFCEVHEKCFSVIGICIYILYSLLRSSLHYRHIPVPICHYVRRLWPRLHSDRLCSLDGVERKVAVGKEDWQWGKWAVCCVFLCILYSIVCIWYPKKLILCWAWLLRLSLCHLYMGKLLHTCTDSILPCRVTNKDFISFLRSGTSSLEDGTSSCWWVSSPCTLDSSTMRSSPNLSTSSAQSGIQMSSKGSSLTSVILGFASWQTYCIYMS